MKKILLLILVALVTYSSSFAIGGFKVVIKKPGAAVDVQVRIVDYSPTGPTTEFTGATVSLTPNASGIIVASVPETPTILATDVNSFYIVEVWTGSPLALSSQQRLDEMIFEQAKTGLTDNEGNVTLEPGKELIFPEPSGSGENFTSFKSPALAADVEYTLPINDGDANQYLKTDGSGIMSWDNPTVTSDASLTGDGAGTPLSLANGAVTTDKIGSSAVTDVKIGTSAVTTAKINNTAVTTDKINDGAVTEAKLANNAVATAKIENKAVTAGKISPGATNGHVLTVSGTDAVWAAPTGGGGSGSGFSLVDNNGTNLGQVLDIGSAGVSVITSTGYFVYILFEEIGGHAYSGAQIYWDGANCTGDAYLNDGGTSGQKRYSKLVVYSNSSGLLYSLANPSPNGLSTSVGMTSTNIENPGCVASAGSNSGWLLASITKVALGLPATITYPLTIQ